ncbi:MAG: hypothetical protein LV471_07480 [Nitrosomonas sp.]|nr:hypothetical protein [Nitrosomonas sp.]
MSETTTYPLRLPKSLNEEVAKMEKRDGTSLNQFISMAVAEKISALNRAKLLRPGRSYKN